MKILAKKFKFLEGYKEDVISFLFYLFLTALVIGGLGTPEPMLVFSFLLVLGIVFNLTLFSIGKKKFEWPPFNIWHILFLATLLLSILWSFSRITAFASFLFYLGGYLFLIFFYNLAKISKNFEDLAVEWLEKSIIVLGLIFGILYLYGRLGNSLNSIYDFSLYLQASADHNHVGDLFAVVLTIFLFKYSKSLPKILFWGLTLTFSFFIVVSHSRSALISAILGIYLIIRNKSFFDKNKSKIIVGAVLLLFIFLSQKGVFTARGYFLQAIAGVIKRPYGAGVGNFIYLSMDPKNQIFGMTLFSRSVHNFVLEIFAGLGVFFLPFLIWLIKSVVLVWESAKTKIGIPSLIFLVLTINFMFDYTYFIPAFYILWVVSLAIIMAKKGSNGN